VALHTQQDTRKSKYAWLLRPALVLLGVLLLAFGLQGAFAWYDFGQGSQGVFRGDSSSIPVVLYDLAKSSTGQILADPVVPLSGAQFQLYKLNGTTWEPVTGGPWITNSAGRIVLDGTDALHPKLPVGTYKFVELDPPYGYEYDINDSGNVITEYPFIITTDMVQAQAEYTVTAYNRQSTGQLAVTKKVTGTNAPTGESYTFHIKFANGVNYSYTLQSADGSHPQQATTDGTFQLKDGETALFTNLPVGLTYAVWEERTGTGYAISSTNSYGSVPAATDTTKRGEVVFTNTYGVGIDVPGALTITKTVLVPNGATADANQEFTFEVTFGDNNSYSYVKSDNSKGTIDGTGTLTLKAGEKAVFDDLPSGLGYTVVEKMDADASTKYISTVDNITGNILPGGSEAAFINLYTAGGQQLQGTGNLALVKKVAGTDEKLPFDFKVTFDKDVAWSYTVYPYDVATSTPDYNTVISQKSDTSSVVEFQLEPGQVIIFNDLPAGTVYLAQVLNLPSGYTAGSVQQKGAVPSDQQTAYAVFSSYKEDTLSSNVVLRIKKEVTAGTPLDALDTVFNFTVTIEGQDATIPIQLKAGETSNAIVMPAGTAYQITEDEKTAEAAGFKCIQANNAAGTASSNEITAVFVNKYVRTRTVVITGQKLWVAPSALSLPNAVRIQLVNKATGAVVAEASAEKDANYTFRFEAPELDDDGNAITYTVQEVQLNGFTSTVTGDQINGFTVTNTYTGPVLSASYVPTVEKQITGDAPSSADEFYFWLEGSTESTPMPSGSTDGRKRITMQGAGSAAFGEITYDTAGTYIYTVYEQTGTAQGYTYDANKYTITVTVTEADGALHVSAAIKDKSGNAATSALFTNLYKTPVTTPTSAYEPKAEVVVVSSVTPPEETFTLVLKPQTNGAPLPAALAAAADTATKTVKITGAGTVSFGSIQYTAAGTYIYTLSQTAGTTANYTYDDTVYILTVEVTDVNGALSATGRITVPGTGSTVQTAVFTNIYSVTSSSGVMPSPDDSDISDIDGSGSNSGSDSGSSSGSSSGSGSDSGPGSTSGSGSDSGSGSGGTSDGTGSGTSGANSNANGGTGAGVTVTSGSGSGTTGTTSGSGSGTGTSGSSTGIKVPQTNDVRDPLLAVGLIIAGLTLLLMRTIFLHIDKQREKHEKYREMLRSNSDSTYSH
jgi:pilin isopeptide linkage protein